jgi:hypothetical protein
MNQHNNSSTRDFIAGVDITHGVDITQGGGININIKARDLPKIDIKNRTSNQKSSRVVTNKDIDHYFNKLKRNSPKYNNTLKKRIKKHIVNKNSKKVKHNYNKPKSLKKNKPNKKITHKKKYN